jgi:predicted DNA-binding transcriptional regulator AlpA
MQSDTMFITSADVARLLDYPSTAAFLMQRRRLEEETLFPLPVATRTRRNLRWNRAQVQAWIARQGAPRGSYGGNLVLLDFARSA